MVTSGALDTQPNRHQTDFHSFAVAMETGLHVGIEERVGGGRGGVVAGIKGELRGTK